MLKIQKLDLLISFYITCILVAELLGGKTFPLLSLGTFKLNASVAILVLPFVFSINDVITEVYGKERTRSVIRSGLFMILFIMIFSIIATNLPPSNRFESVEYAYDIIFTQSIRISAASLLAFMLAELLDVFIFAKLRQQFGKKALWLRNNASNIISQFFDTTLFMFLAFYSFDLPITENFSFLVGLILPYWLLKCFMSIIETPFVYIGVKWLQKK